MQKDQIQNRSIYSAYKITILLHNSEGYHLIARKIFKLVFTHEIQLIISENAHKFRIDQTKNTENPMALSESQTDFNVLMDS